MTPARSLAERSSVTWLGATVSFRRLDDPGNQADLSAAEFALARGAGSERRAQELAAGRAAARAAFRGAGVWPLPEVRKGSDQRPQVHPPNGWQVSLSHDGGLAVAACAREAVGVDVVHLGRADQLARALQSANAPDPAGLGLTIVAGVLPWPAPVVCWSGWEALAKRVGVGLGGVEQVSLDVAVRGGVATGFVGPVHLRWWGVGAHVCCLATVVP